ncbi:hypothetical protein FF36_05842 [Frankia torreyi]|uniref:DUF5666 domain-containing protein n=1 Tax=Frankia torreyi TaxID=1856 RepID=A0A0D8B6Y6_9ACTN|nr:MULTISPECIES: hypothetical protein [Frankia]KJE19855.1 hypothetical protein FF36_05842 [Frankia torreyi]KQM02198.1 hypothetical protein FF86_10762 [Frankia sp. CpI1-P]
MKRTRVSVGVLAATAAVVLSLFSAPAALASGGHGGGDGGGSGDGGGGGGRRLGPAVETSGVGSLGSPWTLKSQHDDDGPGLVAGEEFEITTPPGHVWSVTFADNGVRFFQQDVTATDTGLRAMSKAPDQGVDQIMSVHAVDTGTHEVIDGSVDLPAN